MKDKRPTKYVYPIGDPRHQGIPKKKSMRNKLKQSKLARRKNRK